MDRFSYLNNLMPLCWEPGHMGTFLIRALSQRHIKDSNKRVQYYFKEQDNYEWTLDDRVGSFYGFSKEQVEHYLKVVLDTLRQLCPNDIDFEKGLLHVLLQLTHDHYTEEGYKNKADDVDFWNYNLTADDVIRLYENNYDNSGTVMPIVKFHYANYIYSPLSKIPFNQVINAGYFGNKSWIPEILLFYKRYHYWIETNNTQKLNRILSENNWNNANRLRNIVGAGAGLYSAFNDSTVSNWLDINWSSSAGKKPTVVNIDMYDLIFNKNIDQLKVIDPVYENYVDDSMIALLDKVENQTKFILNKFELDHTLDLELKTKFPNTRLLKTPSLVKALTRVNEISSEFYYK